jgi:branched-chain amino acid aminotransferase
MQLTAYLNDQWIPLEQAALPVTDLGLQRGYGIFDFLRITDGIPLYIDDHLGRFFNSAEKMRLPVGKTVDELKVIIRQLLDKNKLDSAGLRILLTGGPSPDGYQISQPNLCIIQQPLEPTPGQMIKPIKLATYSHMREMPHIKTTNYLMAAWLRPWVKEKGADDVLYHQLGILSECPRSNFFLVMEDDSILTASRNILKGITRKQLIALAAVNNIEVKETDILLDDIGKAKAAFITNSTGRIVPVHTIDNHVFEEPGKDSVMEKLFGLLLEHERSVLQKSW